jgi:hypothetical protein
MAVLFIEGFDKYGPTGQLSPGVATMAVTGEWTTGSGGSIVAPLSSTGYAMSNTGVGSNWTKTLSATYTRIIGGVRFASSLANTNCIVAFSNSGTVACSITANTTGALSIRTGTDNGTAIATTVGTIAANSTHYLEWDITIGASGAYTVYLDGVSVLSGTGNTANSQANINQLVLGQTRAISQNVTWDDLYLFDSTGGTNNAALLNNPVVESAFCNADTATKTWTAGAAIIGTDNSTQGPTNATANSVYVRVFTAAQNMTLNSISIIPNATNAAANFRPVLYASAATGAALTIAGSTVTGCTTGVTMTMPLTTPQSLTAGNTYAIGFMNDTTLSMNLADGGAAMSRGSATFASGAPGTLPTMTTGSASYQCWGNCTSPATNALGVSLNPPIDDISYNFSSTVNNEDLYAFPALASNPASVACVVYKARLKRSDSGSRTVEVRCSSGATDTAGSTAGGVTPGTTFGWLGNYLPTDPNTGIAWTGTGVNNAKGGVKVSS